MINIYISMNLITNIKDMNSAYFVKFLFSALVILSYFIMVQEYKFEFVIKISIQKITFT